MTTVNHHLVWPLLVRPSLTAIQKQNPQAARILAIALSSAEQIDPGFLLDLVNALQETDSQFNESLNMAECLLRAQGRLSTDLQVSHHEPNMQQLCERTALLRKLLARIPDEIHQRAAFLATIKEIASAIKKILDSLDVLIGGLPLPDKRQVEQRKRQLVRDSKQFSQALKSHFKGALEMNELFTNAAQLIYDMNVIDKVCAKSK